MGTLKVWILGDDLRANFLKFLEKLRDLSPERFFAVAYKWNNVYIGPIESIFEGPEILKVLSEELKLPGLKGLCLEPSYSGRRIKCLKILFQ